MGYEGEELWDVTRCPGLLVTGCDLEDAASKVPDEVKRRFSPVSLNQLHQSTICDSRHNYGQSLEIYLAKLNVVVLPYL